jgi:hypothetical protein
MRDLEGDWKRWTAMERLIGALALSAVFAAPVLPWFLGAR